MSKVSKALAILGMSVALAQAQTTIKPFQVRLEVPSGVSQTIVLTNNVMKVTTNGATLDGTGLNWIVPSVNATITGAPSGVTATLTDSNTNALGTVPITLTTANASTSTNLYIKLVFDGTQAGGVSKLNINLTGGVTNGYFPLMLEVGKVWAGSQNAAFNGAGAWSDSSKWQGGLPGVNDVVVFNDLGTQSNQLISTSTSTNLLTNSIVDVSTVIGGLRFAQTNATGTPNTNWHNIVINSGVNLAISGPAGFSFLKDYTYASTKSVNVTISGTNGTLIQTNEAASFAMLADGQVASTLDMSGLGKLVLNDLTVNVGDIINYPNYTNFIANGYTPGSTFGGSRPSKCLPTWKMALTNIIRGVYVDPYNYTNSQSRNYALEIGRNETTGGSSGNNFVMSLGLSNSLAFDGICVGGYASLGSVMNFLNTNSYAIFRNTNGGRMSVIAFGDAAGTASIAVTNNTKCGNSGFGVDFTKGTVDILVDRLYMSMDRGYAAGVAGGGICQSSLAMAAGVLDANTAYIAYQASGNQSALINGDSCTASVTITNTAVFKVNGTLNLGYTTAVAGDPSLPANTKGTITVGPGGTLMASNITVGGTTKASAGNAITLNGNATLVVTNGIGSSTPGDNLGTLTLAGNNNVIKLFLDGNKSDARIYVTNLTASGSTTIVIAGVTNLTYPADVVLIQGAGSAQVNASAFAGVTMPPGLGLTGTLTTDSGNNRVVLHIINRLPNNLIWRGPGTMATWDYTSTNWVTLVNSSYVLTNYNNPDNVVFDGAAGVATNIVVGGDSSIPLTPSSVGMTNNGFTYSFVDGGNQVLGAPLLNKYGNGGVEVDANTTFNINLSQGSLLGLAGGTISGVTVGSGTSMNYAGNIIGAMSVAGTATFSGTQNGVLSVLNGGILTNNGAMCALSGASLSVQTGGTLYNNGSLNYVGVGSAGSPQVATNALMVNDGYIGNNGYGNVLYINGAFQDLGDSGDTIVLQSLSIGAGATFLPGLNTGATRIYSDGTGTFPGALLLLQGGTTVIPVNAATTQATVVTPNYLSYGGSSSLRNNNGCTLLISNTSATPFSVGQSFHIFNQGGSVPNNTGTSTNTYPVILPASPGPGMTWDLSQLWVTGNIGIADPNSGPALTSSISTLNGTNIVVQFSWDSSALGYSLKTLNTTLDKGLSATNWASVPGTWTNTTFIATNTVGTNCVFYRLAFP
ncbi:MAG TPA: hypothetical protein VF607_04530 [Verrucomicrobiae bacterium]